MSRRNLILLAIAIIVVVWVIPWGKKAPALQSDVLVKVVVAKRDLAPYTVIQAEDLLEQQVPAALVTSDAYLAWTELRGSRLISSAEVRKGAILRRSQVLTIDDTSGWIDGDMLITSFYVPTERIVGGQLRPGHHIDLLVTRAGQADSSEALWLAYNLWVVGTHQVSGQAITRPTVALYQGTPVPQVEQRATSGGLFGQATDAITQGADIALNRSETSNLIVVAVSREAARMIGYYVGARLYDGWVYVRPEAMEPPQTAQGRIEGLVYLDSDKLGQRDADEPGLPDVSIKLQDASGQLREATTDATGSFAFVDLPAGVYEIEQIDLPGYASTTPNRKTLYLADDQTLSVSFGDSAGRAVLVSTPGAGLVLSQTPAATAVVSGQPTPQAQSCGVRLAISAQEHGQPQQAFEEGVSAVWAMVTFEGCPAGAAYTLYTRDADSRSDRRIASGTWDGQSPTQAIKIAPREGLAQFTVGAYSTSVVIGPDQSVQAFQLWYVDAPAGGAQPGDLPVSGFGYDQDAN